MQYKAGAWTNRTIAQVKADFGIVSTAYGGTGVDNSTGGTANQFWARPNGATGAATYRAIVAADIPTLNQNTTGSAATLTTPRSIHGGSFNGSADVTNIIASTYGGTGNGFAKFTGPTTSEKTFTLPDASATILYSGGALGTPSSGTLTNATGLPEGGLSLTDITTNNASTSNHGFLKKLDNTATHYMDGTGAWSTPTTVATAMPINGNTAATATNNIDNGEYGQNWAWNTLGATGQYGLRLQSTSTSSSGNPLARLFYSLMSGAHSNSGQSTATIMAENQHSGTTSTNYGVYSSAINATTGIAGYFTASSNTNNYAIIVPSTGGSVGIGNTAPTEKLDVTGNIRFSGALMPNNTAGTSGQVLTSAGAGAVPTWTTPSGSSTTSTLAYVAKTANYTIVSATDYLVDVTANSVTITLPTAASITGQRFVVKNSSTGVVTINTTSSQTVDSYASGALTISQYQSLTLMSNGSNWILE
jgi:hypothetical protein